MQPYRGEFPGVMVDQLTEMDTYASALKKAEADMHPELLEIIEAQLPASFVYLVGMHKGILRQVRRSDPARELPPPASIALDEAAIGALASLLLSAHNGSRGLKRRVYQTAMDELKDNLLMSRRLLGTPELRTQDD